MKLIKSHYCGNISKNNVGEEIILNGWVNSKRDHGDLVFIDIRDITGIVQVVFDLKNNIDCHKQVKSIGTEYVISIKGEVILREENLRNSKISSGDVEVQCNEIEILNSSYSMPFPLDNLRKTHEDLLLEYRFLDLRQKDIQNNLIRRSKVVKSIHNFLNQENFIEIETPILNKYTPEGARDFIVPSRINRGKFYALPQSPQIFKQLLMSSGFDRYYQIAKCFRDEDLRSDRQPEFTQIDLEMSFINKDIIINLMEKMFKKFIKDVYDTNIEIPFQRMSYDEAIGKYGSEKPDVRFKTKISNISDIISRANYELFDNILNQGGEVAAINVKNGSVLSRKEINSLIEYITPFGAKSIVSIKVKDGKLQSGIVKHFSEHIQKELIHQLKGENGDLFLLVSGEPFIIYESLGRLRIQIAKMLNLIDESKLSFVWVVDFPLFEYNRSEKKLSSFHHPFTLPKAEDILLLDTVKDPLKLKSESYDLIFNGVELGGGSLRIFKRTMQEKIFNLLSIEKEEYLSKFGFFLKALEYGFPPHGGIAFGLDRIMMVLEKESSIRNVIAFPKTQKGICAMSNTPDIIPGEQLMDLHIKLN